MRKWTRRSRATAAALALVLGSGLLAGCADSQAGKPGKPDNKITVWSLENLPDRMEASKKVVHRFEQRSGIDVELVGVAENQLPQLIMSAAAAGNLPDVIGAIPMGQVWQMHGNGLLNTEVTTDLVRKLGKGTFDENALRLTADGGAQLAVPSDAWLQILVYRKDLLKKAGLPVPDTYDKMLRAAEKLDTRGQNGAAVATDPGDVFTQQSFESVALANDCQLVDGQGEIRLSSPACRTAFDAYNALGGEHGAAGTQTVDSTRATYFSGKAPMLLWSSFVLDELAGLRKDALPSCPQCTKEGGRYLSDRSGIVTSLRGPDAEEPAQFGEITSWAVTRSAETGASRKFIEYMMNTGYADWFGMSPEGKIPVRGGTADDPRKFERAWRDSSVGVDKKKPMNEVFRPELLDQLTEAVGRMKRWGIEQGEGVLVGATNGELPVPKTIGAMTSGQTEPGEAAREAADEVSALQKSLQ
ncbi:extracellular solute-binding protein [Streptomyces armeniacus]|uniref:Extracellular solute-binding protein n=1 Tax=Streptomyces armeniacus TaxID=83291 RepID=A0A345XSD4_9ACTN|nr:extracellular solute-binding protein [Streptomyces armeniacus]AXK34550.1 extracellular solute-binding protein [Streptomyces armeniacus]